MLTVGLTGGIATGKSIVAGLLEARGCRLFHADAVAHEQIAPGGPAYEAVVDSFGEEIVNSSGTIDRTRLGAIVFADPARLEHLNSLIHPHVLALTEHEIKQYEQSHPDGIFVAEAALHIEIGYHRRFDKLIVTWCPPKQQIERLLARGSLTKEAADQRLNSQMPAESKKEYADYLVDCSGTLGETEEQVARIYQELRKLAQSPGPEG
jgi:dephospho-CoA kinase